MPLYCLISKGLIHLVFLVSTGPPSVPTQLVFSTNLLLYAFNRTTNQYEVSLVIIPPL